MEGLNLISSQWSTTRELILTKTDLQAEVKAAGLRLCSDSPDATGWIQCHAIDREDNRPSCGLNVSDRSFEIGSFKDHGSGERYSFFDLMVKLGKFSDFREAMSHYANQTGVQLPARKVNGSKWGEPVAEYVYRNSDGSTRYKVIKYQKPDGSKDCIPYAPQPDGTWKPGLKKAGISQIGRAHV